MSNPSNLYAEKIYAEHPLVLWALDDKSDYISLISETQRDIENQWITTGGTSIESTIGAEPFPDSITTLLEGDVPVGVDGEIVCISPDLINFSDLNETLGTFSVGSYFYPNSAYIKSISIGYEYTDTTTSLTIQKIKTFETILFQNWGFISSTFETPNEFTNLRAVIKIKYLPGGASETDYQFYLNGITLGQWSEEFNTTSLGVTPEVFPSGIALNTTDKVLAASAYGLSSDEGYYIVSGNALVAKNTSVPLVYGASGVTKLIPNTSLNPSLIIPGKGFLNEVGRYKEYTVEFWARINSDTLEPKRIFGPIVGSNGLYVESGFLTLVIGNSFASHFVGEWVRPMLIQIRIINNSATMILNGEEVISITIDTDGTELPAEFVNGKSQDWLGFYAYEDVSSVEIDCVAIYSYQVPTIVAKRRWVYGQGVLSPEGINSAYGGTSAFIDYPFADYTSNYNYPSFAQWQQGSFDNLITTSTSLTTPEYSLPEISLGSKTLNDFYLDNQEIQEVFSGLTVPYKFITFRPNETWSGLGTYFNFPRLNILNDSVKSIYGVFSSSVLSVDGGLYNSPQTSLADAEYYNTLVWSEIYDGGSALADGSAQTLIKIYNTSTGDFFVIKFNGNVIQYALNYNGVEETLYTTETIESDQLFAVGININDLSNYFGGNVSAFFGNINGLKVYVAGDEEIANSFSGKIYSLGFTTDFNYNSISNYFNELGIAKFDDLSVAGVTEETNAIALIDHTASYTLLPVEAYEKFFLDIGVSGYWQDYLPLSYFAQYVTNDVGNEFYDLDFLQFNIGYPSPDKVLENESIVESWTYSDLKDEYKNPIQKTYEQLGNILYTGWANYEDMQQKSEKYYEYDTTNSSIRSYLTFQYIAEGANAPRNSFSINETPRRNKIIDMDEHAQWANTSFEIIDNTLIYPTKTVDFNKLAVVFNLEFNLRNTLTKPIRLSRLEFASQALSENSFNQIGTRFGLNLFPYKRSGIYYDYKSKNPFSIYKGSTPYLYLDRKSGIQVRGEFDKQINRGIAVPINQELASNYRVSAAQLWMRYDEETFPLIPTEIFEINYKDDTIKFYIAADSDKGTRGRVYAKSQNTGLDFNGLSYFWNGLLVREPVITVKEWGVLGIAFSNALNLDLYLGGINLTGPMLFNNVAYYQANNLQQIQSTLVRPWLKVKTDGITNFNWQYWLNNFTWQGVLVVGTSNLYGVNPDLVHQTYLGTNKIIIDDLEGMIFDADKVKIYADTSWQSSVKIPV
jgi:hypothetical protein